jgi:hypothetical protein
MVTYKDAGSVRRIHLLVKTSISFKTLFVIDPTNLVLLCILLPRDHSIIVFSHPTVIRLVKPMALFGVHITNQSKEKLTARLVLRTIQMLPNNLLPRVKEEPPKPSMLMIMEWPLSVEARDAEPKEAN